MGSDLMSRENTPSCISPTKTLWLTRHGPTGGVARNPPGPGSSHDPAEPGAKKRVQRGGSFLCTDLYCTRYLVGTVGRGEVRTSSNHVGFRCVQAVAR